MPRPPVDQATADRRRALGDRLRRLRAAAGLTQEQAAQAAGMERAFYAKLEGGHHGVMTDRLWDIAHALGVGPADLLPSGRPGTSA